MDHTFKFFKGRSNIEKFRVKVRDTVVGNHCMEPLKDDVIELVAVGVVISSTSSEIMWEGDILSIKPTIEHLSALPMRSFSRLELIRNGERYTLTTGYIIVN